MKRKMRRKKTGRPPGKMRRKQTGRPPGMRAISIWLQNPLIAKLDRRAKRLTEEKGVEVSRSALVRILLERGLDQNEAPGVQNGPEPVPGAADRPNLRPAREKPADGQETRGQSDD